MLQLKRLPLHAGLRVQEQVPVLEPEPELVLEPALEVLVE
jgi:hypothetical protein